MHITPFLLKMLLNNPDLNSKMPMLTLNPIVFFHSFADKKRIEIL